MSLAKLRLSPYYGRLAKFQLSEEGSIKLEGVADADVKVLKQICSHLDLAFDKKDGKVVITKPGHDFFEALDVTAPEAKDKAGLSGYVARGDLIGAEKLAKRGTCSQTNLFTALLALPQGSEPDQGCRLLEAMSATAEWPAADAKKFFDQRARQTTMMFLGEGKEALEAAKNKDTEALVKTGRNFFDCLLSDGRVKGEIQVSNSNKYEGGRRGRDGENEEMFMQQGRGILTGDCVQIQPMDGGHKTECEVVVANPLILRPLAEPPPNTTGSGRTYRVDGLANRQQFARTLTAVHLIAAPPTKTGNVIRDRRKTVGLSGSNRPSDDVLAVLLGRSTQAPKVKGSKMCKDRDIVMGLNRSQREAMSEASKRCFTLVQGPPGTGKTTVAIRILRAWALTKPKGGGGVLCTSDSNIAVDNIVEGLARFNVSVVRVGRPEVARPEVLEHCADEIAKRELGLDKREDKQDSNIRDRVKQAVQAAITRADVVCCTAIGAGSVVLNEHSFSRVLVDEAAQATELATLPPLCRGALQVVLCGDQCQLPPTIGVDCVRDEGLEVSLFERLTSASHQPHILLDAQHRMHPAISAFSRAAFYGGRLMDGIEASERPPPKGFKWPNSKMPLCFIQSRGSERREGESYYNEKEADRVVDAVQDLMDGGLEATQIGVVTPYAAQVRLVRRLLVRAKIPTTRERGGVETNSVDGYQGREKEAIIISTVRSSSSGGLGFVADWRRANVAFTRAKRGLIVIGDSGTLGREPSTWAPWLKWIKKVRCYSPSGCLDDLPTPRGEAAAVGLPVPDGRSVEELLQASAESWKQGSGEKEYHRKRSRSPSQCEESDSEGSAASAKKRRKQDEEDVKDAKDKKKKDKKQKKKEKKKDKKAKKKEKKAKKKKKSSSSDSSSSS